MIDADRERQAAEQAGRDVVDVRGTAGDYFAFHRKLEQLQPRQRRIQQRIRGHHRGHRGGRRSAQTGTERDALVDVHFNAEIQRERGVHGLHRAARGIVRRVHRQITGDSADRANAHHRLVDPAQAHPVADGLHRVAQNIEAYADVGNGGRRESGDIGEH